jgi:epsilon-lactone hydrolase
MMNTMTAEKRHALSGLYRYWNDRTAGIDETGFGLIRDLYTGWARYAPEAPGVSYESVSANGVPAIWAVPRDEIEGSAVLYTHGGGFIGGGIDSHRKLAAHVAAASQRRTLLIDYRLAPEHLYPAQLEDSTAALDWLIDQGYAPARIGLVGDSAGGLLATRLGIVRAQQDLPQVGAIVALSPYYDLEGKGESFDRNRENDPIASREGIVQNLVAFLPEGATASDTDVNVLHADLTGLPPVFVSFGGFEALVDGGTMFAERARAAGVEVVNEVLDEMDHVPQFLVGYAPEATASVEAIGAFLRDHLAD